MVNSVLTGNFNIGLTIGKNSVFTMVCPTISSMILKTGMC